MVEARPIIPKLKDFTYARMGLFVQNRHRALCHRQSDRQRADLHRRDRGLVDARQKTREEAEAVADREAIAIVPLSIPLLAGPGAISSMIIAAQQNPGLLSQLSLSIPIGVICLFVWLALSLSTTIAARMGTIGINVVTRLMGLILAAMAVEFIAHGLQGLFPQLA